MPFAAVHSPSRLLLSVGRPRIEQSLTNSPVQLRWLWLAVGRYGKRWSKIKPPRSLPVASMLVQAIGARWARLFSPADAKWRSFFAVAAKPKPSAISLYMFTDWRRRCYCGGDKACFRCLAMAHVPRLPGQLYHHGRWVAKSTPVPYVAVNVWQPAAQSDPTRPRRAKIHVLCSHG